MKQHAFLSMTLAVTSLAFAGPAAARTVCTAAQDAATGAVLITQGECAERVTAASTFKIAISLMGYDAGVLKDAHDPSLQYEERYAAWRPEWVTTDPTTWMSNSVVWYSQETTTALGEARFSRYVRDFGYGNQDVSGGLTRAWLSSTLQISPVEQVAFLRKMLLGRLPVSSRAVEMTARLTAQPGTIDGWAIHGKTGSGSARAPDGSDDRAREFGWFVGWAQKGEHKVVFAHLIQLDGASDEPAGFRARREFLGVLPKMLRKGFADVR